MGCSASTARPDEASAATRKYVDPEAVFNALEGDDTLLLRAVTFAPLLKARPRPCSASNQLSLSRS